MVYVFAVSTALTTISSVILLKSVLSQTTLYPVLSTGLGISMRDSPFSSVFTTSNCPLCLNVMLTCVFVSAELDSLSLDSSTIEELSSLDSADSITTDELSACDDSTILDELSACDEAKLFDVDDVALLEVDDVALLEVDEEDADEEFPPPITIHEASAKQSPVIKIDKIVFFIIFLLISPNSVCKRTS